MHWRTPPSPVRRRLGLSVLAVACLLGIATACTSPASESALPGATGAAADPASTRSASAMDPEEAMLQWAQCMRDHGVDVPDPDKGRVAVDGSTVAPEQLEAAEEACDEWQRLAEPEGGGTPLTAEEKQSFLDHAACMRDRGWNVPDPTFDGGRVEQMFRRGAETAPGDPAPGDPRFDQDLEECADAAGLELPGRTEGE